MAETKDHDRKGSYGSCPTEEEVNASIGLPYFSQSSENEATFLLRFPEPDNTSRRIRIIVMRAFLVVIVVFLFLVAWLALIGGASDPSSDHNSPMPSPSQSCRSCNYIECKSALCPRRLDEYFMCVEGPASQPVNGCSANPTVWPEALSCSECCSLFSCLTIAPPPDMKLPVCSACDMADCLQYGSCGYDNYYVCTKGLAQGGCSDDPEWWLNSNHLAVGECLDCCDTRECGELI